MAFGRRANARYPRNLPVRNIRPSVCFGAPLQIGHRSEPTLVAGELTNGYRSRESGYCFGLVRVEKFQSAFASVRQRRLVEGWLIANGRVEIATAKSTRRTAPRVWDQYTSPDGRRVRSIRIQRPSTTKTQQP